MTGDSGLSRGFGRAATLYLFGRDGRTLADTYNLASR